MRCLGTILLLIIPLTLAEASPNIAWYDALELPSSPQLDVRSLSVQVSGSDLILTVEYYSHSDPKPDYYTGRIYMDVKPGGDPTDVKGADYQIAFYSNPSNLSDRNCTVLAYNDVKLQWEESKALSCSVQISGGKLTISGKGFGRYMDLTSLRLRAIFDSLGKAVYRKPYSLSNSGRATLDGNYGEYRIPLISKQQVGTLPPIDYGEVYALDDLSRLYLALVPSTKEGVSCDLRGVNSRLTRNYFIELDSDGNETNGVDLSAAYSYICTPEGRRWFPYTLYAGSDGIAVGKAVEISMKLLPSLGKLSHGEFDVIVRVTLIYRDSVPDSGWIVYSTNLPSAKELEVTGSKVDVEMNKDLSGYFKSIGSASGTFRVGLGGPAVDPSYSAGGSVRFLKGEDGLYRGVEFNGRSYWVSYGQRDYAVVRVVRMGEGYYYSVAGVTRYGTRAGLVWLSQNAQALSPGSAYLIGWMDNGNGVVEFNEISLLDIGS
ncbi:MAG: hypothetical protein QXO55_04065 [Candidatus Korarchaeum sp.]